MYSGDTSRPLWITGPKGSGKTEIVKSIYPKGINGYVVLPKEDDLRFKTLIFEDVDDMYKLDTVLNIMKELPILKSQIVITSTRIAPCIFEQLKMETLLKRLDLVVVNRDELSLFGGLFRRKDIPEISKKLDALIEEFSNSKISWYDLRAKARELRNAYRPKFPD